MITAVVLVAVLGLVIALIVAIARDSGPDPAEVALAYEAAWDRLDFDTLWRLSAVERREGLDRRTYVGAKRTAYAARGALAHLVREASVDAVDITDDRAAVGTRLELAGGGAVHNQLHLVRRDRRWQVVEYSMRLNA
jgi:hypothetical protein